MLLQVLLALFAFDDYTGFQVTQLLELPQPWSIIIVWGLVLPGIFLAASALTNIVLKDALILKVILKSFPNHRSQILRKHGMVEDWPAQQEGQRPTAPMYWLGYERRWPTQAFLTEPGRPLE